MWGGRPRALPSSRAPRWPKSERGFRPWLENTPCVFYSDPGQRVFYAFFTRFLRVFYLAQIPGLRRKKEQVVRCGRAPCGPAQPGVVCLRIAPHDHQRPTCHAPPTTHDPARTMRKRTLRAPVALFRRWCLALRAMSCNRCVTTTFLSRFLRRFLRRPPHAFFTAFLTRF